jgi:hypothetical protein
MASVPPSTILGTPVKSAARASEQVRQATNAMVVVFIFLSLAKIA